LRETIQLVIEDPDRINRIAKELCPFIALVADKLSMEHSA